ncbi:hypothetical protein I5776_09705 [Heyndrickxia vini]|uniref:YxeA family protein n=1 Tax=Heyndrickxia vini TaxID=1476025 RepID=A0ABX7E749_9BACI|nr:hypothetical protein I5776_09705 [Heyndrickxia vini]
MKSKKYKVLTSIILIGIFVFLAYINTITENELSNVHMSLPVSTMENEKTITNDLNPVLEYKLVNSKKDKEQGYVVETYREFEIYKDKNGTIYKTIPTENYNYLKYNISEDVNN